VPNNRYVSFYHIKARIIPPWIRHFASRNAVTPMVLTSTVRGGQADWQKAGREHHRLLQPQQGQVLPNNRRYVSRKLNLDLKADQDIFKQYKNIFPVSVGI